MNRHKTFRLAVALVMATALTLSGVFVASAAPPANDNFTGAQVIGTLPFSGTVDLTDATTEPGESFFCNFTPVTAWFSFTPTANAVIRADTAGSSFGDTNLTVYQAVGSGLGGLSFLMCTSFGGSVTFNVQAGTTYYLQVGKVNCGYPPCGGILQLNLQEIPLPPNDNFNSATQIDLNALPFSDSVDITNATTESGEPQVCFFSQQTLWYKLTAATDTWLKADTLGSSFSSTNLNVYRDTGSGIFGLSFLGCASFGSPITFRAQAGATYYLQAEALCCGISGNLRVNVEQIPPPLPVASFGFFPGDPSIFDTMQFFDQSFDPGQVGIQSQAWDFGDGATATGCCPTHRFTADADYTVQLTVTTFDGRMASTTRSVHVKTHDVAIVKLSVPKSGMTGKTASISVDVTNKRYPETVEVQIYKSTPNGFQLFGTLTLFVPVRTQNKSITTFRFSYTFTGDDASIGKVSFRAFAVIVGARDALPADNEAIAPPTKVSR